MHDGAPNAAISRAPAQVATSQFRSLDSIGARYASVQVGQRHRDTGCAVAALQPPAICQRVTHRRAGVAPADGLIGVDTASLQRGRHDQAGVGRRTVEPHHTGATPAYLAAGLRGGQGKRFAHDVKQAAVGRTVEFDGLTVQVEAQAHHDALDSRKSSTSSGRTGIVFTAIPVAVAIALATAGAAALTPISPAPRGPYGSPGSSACIALTS